MMNRLFKSKRELIRKINALENDNAHLLKANKKLLHNSNVIKIKNFNLKQEIDKLQNGALDKNIVTDYENIIGSLKHENSYLRIDFLDNLMGLFDYTKRSSFGYDSWAGHFWDYDIIDKNGTPVWSSNDVAMSSTNELIIWSEIVCKILRNEGLENEMKLLGTDLRNYLRVENHG